MNNGNGQGMAIDPEVLINSLVQRVQQLTMENVMLQAALDQLKGSDGTHNPSPVGSQSTEE